jgi:putative ABC transport system substrate-binding protein
MNFNKRTIFVVFVILVLAVVGIFSAFIMNKKASNRQVAQKVYKIGILNGFDYVGKNVDGFKAGMAELGYIEGENVLYDVQKADPDVEKYQAILKGFANEKVDLLFAFPTEASLEAKKVTQETGIPLVFVHANYEGMNLINSIKEPGNNLTGVRYPGPDVALKRLEVLLEILPKAKNIVVPYFKGYPNVPPQTEILNKWAPTLGVNIIEMPVSSPEELEKSLNDLLKKGQKIDSIMTLAEPVSGTPSFTDVFGKFADDNNIPVCGTMLLKERGYKYETIFGVDTDTFASGKQAAPLADKVLRGIPAGTIPVESAEVYYEINYKKASEMGIPLSESILKTANKVIR